MGYEQLHTDPDSARQIGAMSPEELEALTEFFHSFSDGSRIRILSELAKAEICVNDLAEALGMTQSAVSHQLRILKQNRLIKSRRNGKQILYSLDDEHVGLILETGVRHIREQFPIG